MIKQLKYILSRIRNGNVLKGFQRNWWILKNWRRNF